MNKYSLILQFAYQPNKKRLCGIKDDEIFSLHEKHNLNENEEKRIHHFIKHLQTVNHFTNALKNTKNNYESYVIGYPNFKKTNETVVPYLQEHLKNAPLAKSFKLDNLHYNVPWNHTAFVLYMGALYNSKVPIDNIDFLDKCKVSLGTVQDGKTVWYNKLRKNYDLIEESIEVKFPFFDAKPGQKVLLHHEVAFFRPTDAQEQMYQKSLNTILKVAKNAWK